MPSGSCTTSFISTMKGEAPVRRLNISRVTRMPSFTWNQADLVECLGVVPRVAEHAVKHTFVVVREGYASS